MKRLTVILLIAALTFSATGCNKTQEEQTILQIAQNDYAGAYQRLTFLQQDVLDKMKILEEHNYIVMSGNPTDYWSEDDFYFVNFLPVYNEQLVNTSVFNEIDDFSVIQNYLINVLSEAGYQVHTVLKKADHHYKLQYSGVFTNIASWQQENGTMEFDCIYDPSGNRMKVSSTLTFNTVLVTDMYEFAEIGEYEYVIQNSTERLYVRYDKEGHIEEFKYSTLLPNDSLYIKDNMTTEEYNVLYTEYGFNGYVFRVPTLENTYATYFNNGDVLYFEKDAQINRYHRIETIDTEGIMKAASTGYYDPQIDSIYLDFDNIDSDWVFEAESFNKTITYKDGTLSVMTTNPLTKDKQNFTVREQIATEEGAGEDNE